MSRKRMRARVHASMTLAGVHQKPSLNKSLGDARKMCTRVRTCRNLGTRFCMCA